MRKVNVGKVTALLDEIFVTNSARADARRVKKRKDEEEAETRKNQKKGIKFNKNMEEPLAATIGDLLANMKAMNNAVGVSRDYLRRQCNARMMRAEIYQFLYPSIGDQFRAKNKKRKIKLKPSDDRNEIDYLKALVILMMKADFKRGAVEHDDLQITGLLRKVPTLNVLSTNTRALTLRKELEQEVCRQATQADDPWLIFLTNEYVGKICFLDDIAERHKLYRVCSIAY